jgi:hypothetical protein
MGARKKLRIRPNLGGSLRPKAEAPRRNFLYIEVTEEERKAIRDYCISNKISVSQFLADVVLKDARKPQPNRKQKVIVQAELELTLEEREKLELLTRMHQKDSIGQFIREVLQRNLEVQRLHAPLKTTALRYYLSEEEHQTVTRYMTGKGMAARNYAVMLALKAIRKSKTTPK